MADTPQFIPQQQNANDHSQRGQGMLTDSIQNDGWISCITTAADGEAFDGSLRLEVSEEVFPDVEPIIVRSNGDRPIIHIREDIPTANTPQAKRLSVSANRVAEVSLSWNADVLQEWDAEGVTDRFWLPEEIKPWGASEEKEAPAIESQEPKLITCPSCGHTFSAGGEA